MEITSYKAVMPKTYGLSKTQNCMVLIIKIVGPVSIEVNCLEEDFPD